VATVAVVKFVLRQHRRARAAYQADKECGGDGDQKLAEAIAADSSCQLPHLATFFLPIPTICLSLSLAQSITYNHIFLTCMIEHIGQYYFGTSNWQQNILANTILEHQSDSSSRDARNSYLETARK